jgi:3-hydroxy-9,10-secoandrosta-1,3,5(10)-triene-9,17-dione monooxygenase
VIYDQNPLSQAFRDANTAARHLTQNWDINAAAHGRVVIGLPIDNPPL